MMPRKKLLLLLKPLNTHPVRQFDRISRSYGPKIIRYHENRRKVHQDSIDFCQEILRHKFVDWESIFRDNVSKPICNVDLVVTVGGDGTLLHASHLIDDSIPVLGVNPDPTQDQEVQEFGQEFDASRSTGYLCGATIKNFGQVLDGILKDETVPSKLSRIAIHVNSQLMPTYALNDILMAHPCPAAVSRLSFRIKSDEQQPCSSLVNCRSSGLRVCTAAGSTAAMRSAGGFPMPILSQDLQYMVREPIAPTWSPMHGLIKHDQYMDATWFSKEGRIYIDGYHVFYPIQDGDTVQVSSKAPILQVFLRPDMMLTKNE